MTPKEKAEELVEKYVRITREYYKGTKHIINIEEAKKRALIDVNEILSNDNLYTELFIFYSDVKSEIYKL
jgi:hypothetical protein